MSFIRSIINTFFQLLQLIYPDLYRVDNINLEGCLTEEDENGGELLIPQPDRLQLSFERISATGILNFFRQFDEFHK